MLRRTHLSTLLVSGACAIGPCLPAQSISASGQTQIALCNPAPVPSVRPATATVDAPWRMADLFGSSSVVKTLERSLSPYVEMETRKYGTALQPLSGSTAEFRMGDDLVVLPPQSQSTAVTITLPAGTWVNYWTGAQVVGGSAASLEVPAGLPPMWARGGAVIERRSGGYAGEHVYEAAPRDGAKNCGDTCVFDLLPAFTGDAAVAEMDLDGRTLTRTTTTLRIQGAPTHAIVRWRFTEVKNVTVDGVSIPMHRSAEGYYAEIAHTADTTVQWTVASHATHSW